MHEGARAVALRSDHTAAAALDGSTLNHCARPFPAGLRSVDLTLHTSGLTAEAAERMAVSSVQNVLDFFVGRLDPALVVNAAVPKGAKEFVR